MARSSLKRALSLGLVLLFVVTGCLWFWQYNQYQQEKLSFTKRLRESRTRLEMSQVTAARLAEFRREFTQRQGELAALRRELPAKLGVELFKEELSAWVRGSAVALEEFRFTPVLREIYREAEIRIVLDCSRDELEALVERQDELGRLVAWHGARAGESDAEIRLSVFAFDVERIKRPHPCTEVEASDRTWLWLYADRFEGFRTELAQVCEELSRLKAIDAKVQEYRQLLREYDAAKEVLQNLKDAQ